MNIMKYARDRAITTGSLYWYKIKQELDRQNIQSMSWADYRQMIENDPEIQRLYGEYHTYCDILEMLGEEDAPELRGYAQEAMEYIYDKVVKD